MTKRKEYLKAIEEDIKIIEEVINKAQIKEDNYLKDNLGNIDEILRGQIKSYFLSKEALFHIRLFGAYPINCNYISYRELNTYRDSGDVHRIEDIKKICKSIKNKQLLVGSSGIRIIPSEIPDEYIDSYRTRIQKVVKNLVPDILEKYLRSENRENHIIAKYCCIHVENPKTERNKKLSYLADIIREEFLHQGFFVFSDLDSEGVNYDGTVVKVYVDRVFMKDPNEKKKKEKEKLEEKSKEMFCWG